MDARTRRRARLLTVGVLTTVLVLTGCSESRDGQDAAVEAEMPAPVGDGTTAT